MLIVCRTPYDSELYLGLRDIFDENLSVSAFCKERKDDKLADDFPERAIEFVSSHFLNLIHQS
jgi:hypothetical protein